MSVVHALPSIGSPHRVQDHQTGLADNTDAWRRTEPGAQDRSPAAPCIVSAEIQRAEAAYQLMLVADKCLKVGADLLLLELGFSLPHVLKLRERAGPGGGYPQYAVRNIRQTLRDLRRMYAEESRAE